MRTPVIVGNWKMNMTPSEANNYMQNNPKEATQKLFDNNLASGDFDAGLELVESYDYSVKNGLAEDTLKSIFTDYKEIGLIKDQRSVKV